MTASPSHIAVFLWFLFGIVGWAVEGLSLVMWRNTESERFFAFARQDPLRTALTLPVTLVGCMLLGPIQLGWILSTFHRRQR